MDRKTVILLCISLLAIALAGVVYFFWLQGNPDTTQVSVSTDKEVYPPGAVVHVSIRNLGDRSIDIYAPESCALGNFPTRVERFSDGQWQDLTGLCPSIEPLFVKEYDRGYIRHALAGQKSFELELSTFEYVPLVPGQKLRIVYYLRRGSQPIYSNEFTFEP